jgi:hypothetical protein
MDWRSKKAQGSKRNPSAKDQAPLTEWKEKLHLLETFTLSFSQHVFVGGDAIWERLAASPTRPAQRGFKDDSLF